MGVGTGAMKRAPSIARRRPSPGPPHLRGDGLKWSGRSVRIGLWPRLPHACHRLLSIRHCTARPQCEW